MKDDDRKPHEALEGLQLGDGWTVLSRVHRGPELTGGHFSCGYIVEHSDGRRGFLKALDFFSRLAQSADPARALEPLIKAFNFERDLLRSCRRMSRIVTAYTDGAITVPGFPPPNTVQYIIFELADGDIRSLMITSETFDVCLALRALHEIAIGLRQLHTIGVAHQDVNPSNVLRFQPHVGHKLADLGRAAARGSEPPHYDLVPAGIRSYAPPETLYDGPLGDTWESRRLGCDAYHLGSMICSLFTTMGMTPLMMMSLDPSLRWQSWTGTFDEALPFLMTAYAKAVEYVEAEVPAEIRTDLIIVLRELCHPDPSRRGVRQERRGGGRPFDLERYISRLDLLAHRAEVALRRSN